MLSLNKNYTFLWKTFIISPLVIVTFLLSQVEAKAQVRESNTTTETSKFEKELEGINDAESIIINGKKVAKNELVENYILVGDFQYDEQSKTLSISTPTEFPELYYSDLSKFPEELKKRDDDNFLKGFTYFQLTSDDKISAVKLNDHQFSDSPENATKIEKNTAKLDDQNTVYLVDGKEINKNQLNTIKPEQIASVNVKKSVALIKEKGYDTEKVKGLVEITTKE